MKLFITSSLLILISCGKPEVQYVVKPASAENYNYELKERGCTTGSHSFESLQKTCEGLKDEKLNNNCAREDREELFINHDCVGIFSE